MRVAYPFLVAQDVAHQSSVDPKRKSQTDVMARSKLHRWHLEDMCIPGREAGEQE